MAFLCCGRLCILVVFGRSIAILDVCTIVFGIGNSILVDVPVEILAQLMILGHLPIIDWFGKLGKIGRWWRHLLAAPFFSLLLRVFPDGGPRPLSARLYLCLEVSHAAQADLAARKRPIFSHDGVL